MRSVSLSAVLLVIGFGCTTPASRPAPGPSLGPGLGPGGETIYTPIMAIEAAATRPMGVQGTFEMQVRNASYGQGRSKDYVFLNSEEDYRDRRCLTVRLGPAAVRDFLKRGVDPSKAFHRKTIRVQGVAEQLKIFFVSDRGIQSDKYYYQTQVAVLSPDQILVVPE